MTPEAIQKAAERLVSAYEKGAVAAAVHEGTVFKRTMYDIIPPPLQNQDAKAVLTEAVNICDRRVKEAAAEVEAIIAEVCGEEETDGG